MKKILSAILLMACTTSLSQAQPDTLTGVLTADVDLNTNTCYVLKDCYIVPSGRTLTIAPGVKVLAMNDALLVVEPGGRIEASGLANNPIVFTSAQNQGSRTAGYWYGIAIGSDAPINKTIPTMSQCRTEVPGGSNSTASSGWLQYVQIHYAGKADITNDKRLEAGLSLMAVGSGTVIENIQVTNSATNGINFVGGTVNAKELYLLDNYRNSVFFTDGHTGLVQTVLTQTKNPAAHHSAGTHAFYIQNNEDADASTPLTQPTISNATLMGPLHCDPEASVSSDFKNGIHFTNNGGAHIYNSVITGFNGYGLFIEDIGSAERTLDNTLNFSNNTLLANGTNYDHGSFTWNSSTMCQSSMGLWINGPVTVGCEEVGNQFAIQNLAYDPSFCPNFCDNQFQPNFVIDGLNTTLASPDYVGLAGFEELEFRGAIQDADWISVWANYCPNDAPYCALVLQMTNTPIYALQLAPNPARHSTTVQFEADATGKATLYVMDKVSGRIYLEKAIMIQTRGKQSIKLPVNTLQEGVYTIKLVTQTQVMHAQLLIQR